MSIRCQHGYRFAVSKPSSNVLPSRPWICFTHLFKEYNSLESFIYFTIFLLFQKHVMMAWCFFKTSFFKVSVPNFGSIDTPKKILKLLSRSINRCSSSLMSICMANFLFRYSNTWTCYEEKLSLNAVICFSGVFKYRQQ